MAMDAKGRFAMPTRHREALAALCAGQLTLTRDPSGCLLVFPRPAWEAFRDKVMTLPMSAAGWKRIFLGNAMDVEIDAAGRVLVSPELREAASIGKDVTLLGQGSRFELWDRAALKANEDKTLASEMPAALMDSNL